MSWQSMNTAEKIEAIRKVWESGMSAAEIADSIPGCPSRNAIIGLFGRHADKLSGLHLRGGPKPKVKDCAEKPKRKGTSQNKVRLTVVKPLPVPAATFGAPHVVGIRLVDFNGHRCKWGLNKPEQGSNGHLFCGETTKDGRPWCAYHATLAYRPAGKVDERGTDQKQAA